MSQKDTHHAIHHAAFAEAERLTRLLHSLTGEHSREQALGVSDVLIEHWETRTLAHAQAEEEGLYREIIRLRPEYESVIRKLTRDHDILRKLLTEIQGILAHKGWTDGVIQRFEAMLLVNSIHSRDEEAFLFEEALLFLEDEVSYVAEID